MYVYVFFLQISWQNFEDFIFHHYLNNKNINLRPIRGVDKNVIGAPVGLEC